jgi:ATP-binding protein involved in chromosome partitioning
MHNINCDKEKKMRIGIPTNDRQTVESHFGHCKEFALIDCENGKVIETSYVTPPPHEPGVMPKFLAEQKANVILCGGMGQMAVNLFKQNNVDVILGAAGSIDQNVQVFLSGDLESTGSACDHEHDH